MKVATQSSRAVALHRMAGVITDLRTARERVVRRPLDRLLSRGVYSTPLDLTTSRVVLLFYEDFDRDRVVPGDRHAVRFARTVAGALRRGQKTTGFRVAYEALVRALSEAGYTVIENDYALARRNPHYPIGISGYPHILEHWTLPNPAVLGPGLLDHPGLRPDLMRDPRFVSYIVSSEWVRALFEPHYPGACRLWFAGIDMERWPDLSRETKDLDFVLYDKIYTDTAQRRAEIRVPLEAELTRRGLSYEALVYGRYDHASYRALLARARGMIFLCQHETQGLAYQEALSTDVPILAWDPGRWLDPVRFRFGQDEVAASSVPYFEEGVTGERFRDAAGMVPALERFLARRGQYTPRAYVAQNLSLARSAEAYLALYREAGARAAIKGRESRASAPA